MTAGDLLGKTQEELILLLIQLRRQAATLQASYFKISKMALYMTFNTAFTKKNIINYNNDCPF